MGGKYKRVSSAKINQTKKRRQHGTKYTKMGFLDHEQLHDLNINSIHLK
jgi:predicted metalloprotease with PDZ domain